MSAVKLIPTSGGGSVSLVPPTSTSGNDVTITLPSESQTLPTGGVLEQFFYPCIGETVTTSAGDVTLQDVTAALVGTTTHVDLTGSSITYTLPSGTKTVIYEFHFHHSKHADQQHISHFKFYIDSDEVTKAYMTEGVEYTQGLVTFMWPIRIGGTADTTSGRLASWTSNKTLKMTYREYSSNNETRTHMTSWTEGTGNDTLVVPRIGITALTT